MTPPLQSNIPQGLCQCGCGRTTDIIAYNIPSFGWKKGEPKRFINGHNSHLLAQPRPPLRSGVVEDEPVVFIPLTRGFETIVDASDAPRFIMRNWYYRKGYAFGTINGKAVRLHALIFNAPDGMEPDHKNRNGLDNRKSNLRAATREQNVHNQGPKRIHPTGFKGVTVLPNGKYRARIRVSGKPFNLGVHVNIEDAALAYDQAASRLCGEFAYLNLLSKAGDK